MLPRKSVCLFEITRKIQDIVPNFCVRENERKSIIDVNTYKEEFAFLVCVAHCQQRIDYPVIVISQLSL